jgi:hypothetical protein
MAYGDAREGKWRRNWRMEWVAITLHATSEHGVSSITTADAHTSAASSRLNWCPRRFKWTRPFRRKMKSGLCACAITFQTQSITNFIGVKGKGKGVPLQAWSGPEVSRNLRFPDYMTTAQNGGKAASLTHRPPLPPGNALGTHFC